MPLTPYHLGPGVAIKAAARSRLSLIVFGWTQVLMDIQPLVVMLTGEGRLHGFSHTLLGATGIGAVAAATGKVALDATSDLVPRRMRGALRTGWAVALGSGLLGAYTHLALDSVMHSDVRPLFPASDANPLLGVVSLGGLHLALVVSGALGALIYVLYSLLIGQRVAVGASTRVAAPPESVAAVLLDARRAPDWTTDLQRMEVVSGTPGAVGSRARLHYVEGVQPYVLEDELLETEEARRYLSRVEGRDLAAVVETRLDPRDLGTEVRIRWVGRGKTLPLRLMLPIVRESVAHQARVDLEKLRDIVESERPPTA